MPVGCGNRILKENRQRNSLSELRAHVLISEADMLFSRGGLAGPAVGEAEALGSMSQSPRQHLPTAAPGGRLGSWLGCCDGG